MNKIVLSIISLLILGCAGVENKKVESKTQTTEVKERTFVEPKIPTMLIDENERVDYYIANFWKEFNFNDQSIIGDTLSISKHFAKYANALRYGAIGVTNSSLIDMLKKAERAGINTYNLFFAITELYLYNPNSVFRDEELYIQVLNQYINSSIVDDLYKERPKYQLKQALKNRINDIATDFTYITSDGEEETLHKLNSPFTLVMFSNLGCPECANIVEILSSHPLTANGSKIKILTIFPDKAKDVWEHEIYPKHWISAYDKEQMITEKELYDLRAIPTLYLLDKDKRVILKDPTVELLMNFFQRYKTIFE